MFALLIQIIPFAVVAFVVSFFTKNRALSLSLRFASGLIIAVTAALFLLFAYLARVDPYF